MKSSEFKQKKERDCMASVTKKQLSYKSLLAKAIRIFNAFIRERDRDKGCITCGAYKIEHACHFYSAGFYSALRFNEDNVHGGCLQCNYFKHGSGNEYRRNIALRIGKDRLSLLDSVATRNGVKKWQRFELELICIQYGKKQKT